MQTKQIQVVPQRAQWYTLRWQNSIIKQWCKWRSGKNQAIFAEKHYILDLGLDTVSLRWRIPPTGRFGSTVAKTDTTWYHDHFLWASRSPLYPHPHHTALWWERSTVLTTLGTRVNSIIYWKWERGDRAEQQTFQTLVTLVSTEETWLHSGWWQHPQDVGGDLLPCGLSSSLLPPALTQSQGWLPMPRLPGRLL